MYKLKTFARNLDKIRKGRRKSLNEFAQEIGIPKSTMQSILKDGNTTLDTAVRIATALHVPLSCLLSTDFKDSEFEHNKHDEEEGKNKDGCECKDAPEPAHTAAAEKKEETKAEEESSDTVQKKVMPEVFAAESIRAIKEMLSEFSNLDHEQQIALEYYIVRIMEIIAKQK